MKKLLMLIPALALACLAGPVTAKAAHKSKATKYEVVDVNCYMTKGAHGAKHKECAVKCISGGGELALLHSGKLYVPVDQDFHSAREQFASKAGEMVEVKGKKFSKGGVNYIQVASESSADASK